MNNENQPKANNLHIPRWNELPDIDLFIEQVVTFINRTLTPYIYTDNTDEAELLTKTMINNYVKNNIIEAPNKKQYSKTHLAKLFVICVLKQVYSMQEIKVLIDIALNCSDIQTAYDKFCTLFENALECTYNKTDFIDNYTKNDNQYLLKTVLFSCSYKIYVKNITLSQNKNEQ